MRSTGKQTTTSALHVDAGMEETGGPTTHRVWNSGQAPSPLRWFLMVRWETLLPAVWDSQVIHAEYSAEGTTAKLTSGGSLSAAHIDSTACSPDSMHMICTIYTQHMMGSGSKTKQEPQESGLA